MKLKDVIEVLAALEDAGITPWIDGGWGVDALVGEETREHADLDLAIDSNDLDPARSVLEALGFRVDSTADPGLPARLVLTDHASREVDIHPLKFDDEGNGWQQLSGSGEAWGLYPAGDLQSKGRIGDKAVRCLSPELQFRFRLGYEWSDKDRHDLILLVERFRAGPLLPSNKGMR